MPLPLETLTSIIRTGLPILVLLIDLVNCATIDLTQIVNFPTRISDCDSHSPDFLGLFLCSDARISSTMDFPPLVNSDHVVVSVSIEFPPTSQRYSPFYHIVYDYSRADWDGLRDHLRNAPWEDIFKLGASAEASEFCEWFQIGVDVYIP